MNHSITIKWHFIYNLVYYLVSKCLPDALCALQNMRPNEPNERRRKIYTYNISILLYCYCNEWNKQVSKQTNSNELCVWWFMFVSPPPYSIECKGRQIRTHSQTPALAHLSFLFLLNLIKTHIVVYISIHWLGSGQWAYMCAHASKMCWWLWP